MKFTKLSLIAAIAVSSAFAGGDIAPAPVVVEETSPWTVGGDFKLYYDTTTTNLPSDDRSLFDQASATGQGAASVDVSYAFADTWKVNFGATGLFTLGLDDSVVSGVWLYAGADATNGALANVPGAAPYTSIGDALWIDTFNVTGTMFDGKATVVLGRQTLDTPLAFTETWNIAPNTFDAAVALVKPIDALTLVAAYIYDGNGNGGRISTFDSNPGGFTGDDGYIPAFADKGAWTVAAIGTVAGVTAQAWYYDVLDIAQAAWIQGDTEISGFTLGAQYAWMTPDDALGSVANLIEDSSAFAGKIGYKMDAFNVWAAYSAVDDVAAGHTALPVANTATIMNGAGAGGFGWGSKANSGQSKLYTEAWWNYGLVGQSGADTFAAAASYNVGDLSIFNGIELMAQYTSVSDANPFLDFAGNTIDMNEFTALVGAKAYGLDVQLAYIYSDYTSTDANGANIANGTFTADTIQAYLTYTF